MPRVVKVRAIVMSAMLVVVFITQSSLVLRAQSTLYQVFLPLTTKEPVAEVTPAFTYGTSQYSFQVLAEITNRSDKDTLYVTLQTVSRSILDSSVTTNTTTLKPIVTAIPPRQRIPAIANGTNPGIVVLSTKIFRVDVIPEPNIAFLTIALEKIERAFGDSDVRCFIQGTIFNNNPFAVRDFTVAVWMFNPQEEQFGADYGTYSITLKSGEQMQFTTAAMPVCNRYPPRIPSLNSFRTYAQGTIVE